MTEDSELLKCYREEGSRDAFAEIVNRHVNLVYSVATRQLGNDAHLAHDVSQEVFLSLAQKAKQLSSRVVLSGWLYRSALLAAKDAQRKEIRRRQRERSAMSQENQIEYSSENWEQARPLLDAAICDLNQSDQAAIALRFFHEKNHAEIGQHLGISEDAARMRVKRALDKLHTLLARRGVASSGAALGIALAGQATIAAPSSLSATITQAAFAKLYTATSTSSFNGLIAFMNTTRAASVSLSVASIIAVGSIVYYSSQLAAAEENLWHLRQEFARHKQLNAEASSLKTEIVNLLREAGSPQTPNATPISAHGFTEEEFEIELEAWAERADHLAEYVAQNQRYHIPELDAADAATWMDSVKEGPLETEADYRKALARLREKAKQEAFRQISVAMHRYLKDNDNRLPVSISELVAYSDTQIDPAILARYRIDRSSGEDVTMMERQSVILSEEPVDPIWEYNFRLYPRGSSTKFSIGFGIDGAYYKFKEEHGRTPHDEREIAPYLPDYVSPESLIEYRAAKLTPVTFDTPTPESKP